MTGGLSSLAAFNACGTQATAATCKLDDDFDVVSVFHNKHDNTKQLIYGSNITEIPSSGASTLDFGNSRIYTINSDVDALGELFLQLEARFPNYKTNEATAFGNSGLGITLTPKPFAILSVIESVEIQIGTQTWHTMPKEDIRVVNETELDPGAFAEHAIMSSAPDNALTNPAPVRIWLVLPMFTRTLGPQLQKIANQTEDGYLMAAAPHQSVKVKITFAEEPPKTLTWKSHSTPTGNETEYPVVIQEKVPYNATINLSSGSYSAAQLAADKSGILTTGFLNNTTAVPQISSCVLYAKVHIMCNEEREQVKAMPLPKRVKMTQNAFAGDVGTSVSKTIDLDHFSLYTSHLIISGNLGLDPSGKPIKLKSAELKLNSSSYSGQLPGVLLESATADSLGIFANKFTSAPELAQTTANFTVQLNSDSTSFFHIEPTADNTTTSGSNFIPGKTYNITFIGPSGVTAAPSATFVANSDGNFRGQTPLTFSGGTFNSVIGVAGAFCTETASPITTDEFGMGTYVFPLASTAYSGSSVPLNRFDSVRLTLIFTSAPSPGSGTFINVTDVGTTTALYSDGACSVAMY